MASAWGLAEGLQVLADYGPPPREFERLCQWILGYFSVDVVVTEALPLALLGCYVVLPALCRAAGLIYLRPAVPHMRWTLLHELGHHLTDPSGKGGYLMGADGWYRASRPEERAADQCAAALAIDAGELREYLFDARLTLPEAGARFDVPARAIILRSRQLDFPRPLAYAAASWGWAEWA